MTQDNPVAAIPHVHPQRRACRRLYQRRPMPGLAAPAAALLVLLDDKDTFLSEQDYVFVAEHESSSASGAGCR
jgi:hypothetical protein